MKYGRMCMEIHHITPECTQLGQSSINIHRRELEVELITDLVDSVVFLSVSF